jgi:hypothetical protein
MEIEKFITKCEFLYHLTDSRNWNTIRENGMLLSTETIVNRSNLGEQEKEYILHNRRPVHQIIEIDNTSYFLRDQRPISVINLRKCLTEGWTTEDFIFLLNSRVYFWPNLKRLWSHFARYSHENPIILKVSTKTMLDLNHHSEFCCLNSGATRSNSYWNGGPPPRGEGTFRLARYYSLSAWSVAEVTFPNQCLLPHHIFYSYNPDGPWQEYIF